LHSPARSPERVASAGDEIALGLGVDRQIGSRNDDVEPNVEERSGVMVTLQAFHEGPAAYDAVEKFLELGGLGPDQPVQPFGRLEPAVGDLDGKTHAIPNPSSVAIARDRSSIPRADRNGALALRR
jgi:hypothetical protein